MRYCFKRMLDQVLALKKKKLGPGIPELVSSFRMPAFAYQSELAAFAYQLRPELAAFAV
jgi:hypothetical protein